MTTATATNSSLTQTNSEIKTVPGPHKPTRQWRDAYDVIGVMKLLNLDPAEYLEIRVIPLDAINKQKSRHNQARDWPKAVREEKVNHFVKRMSGGFMFPRPLVTFIRSGSEYCLLGGNHRHEAAERLGDQYIEVYVLTATDEKLILEVKRLLNTFEGTDDTHDERLASAVLSVMETGEEVGAAADYFSVRKEEISQAIRAKEVGDELVKFHIDPKKIAATALYQLASLQDNRNVFLKVARYVSEHGLPVDAIKEMKTSILRAPTEADKLAAVDTVALTYVSKVGSTEKYNRSRPGTQFHRLAAGLRNKMKNCKRVQALGFTSAEASHNIKTILGEIAADALRLSRAK